MRYLFVNLHCAASHGLVRQAVSCANRYNLVYVAVCVCQFIFVSVRYLFVGTVSHGLNLLTRRGSEAGNISEQGKCPPMFGALACF